MKYASQNAKKNMSRTFVAVNNSGTVGGYYSLSSAAIAIEDLPESKRKKLPRYPVPAATLGRLAVDKQFQGEGLGSGLLIHALKRVEKASDELGIHAVIVEAIDENAKAFYVRHGFEPFVDQPLNLFLPLDAIRRLSV